MCVAGFAGGKGKDGNYRDPVTEALLRRAAEGQLGSGALGAEADRTRLIPVAQKLVELGAQLETQDAEGRTALHLAAGCGDRAMVLKLIEIGADVNCHDGVGGGSRCRGPWLLAYKACRRRSKAGDSNCRRLAVIVDNVKSKEVEALSMSIL